MIQAKSIDSAAWGFVRHRFVRGLASSGLVVGGSSFAAIAIIAFAEYPIPRDAIAAATYLVLSAALAVTVVLFIALANAVVDWTHRRLVAAVVLPLCAAAAAFELYFVIGALAALAGVLDDQGVFGRHALWVPWAAVASSLLQGLIVLEALAWAFWQLSISRESYFAVRGWRPSLRRPLSTLQRRLGLPPFLANFGRGRVRLFLLYLCVAVLNTGLLALLYAELLVEFALADDKAGYFGRRDSGILVGSALALLFVLNLLGVGHWIAQAANRRATRLYQDVRTWDARSPVVFLRAFDQDEVRLRVRTRDPFVRLAAGVSVARTLDEILLEQASPYGPVIAIGDPRDPTPPLGAARIFVPGEDLSWQNVVGGLVSASRAIVICPADTEGVRWELELLARAGAAERTILLANPALAPEVARLLFERAAPEGGSLAVRRGQIAIAAFRDPVRGFRVLSARRYSVQTASIALNIALQALFGPHGAPLSRRK